MVLEVGSGLSPVTDADVNVFYSDLSFLAMKTLRLGHGGSGHVVADVMDLPFKTSAFSHVIASEVLEHLPDDRRAITEMTRVMESSGSLVMTFPHGQYYFACDDRFVKHYRRYSLDEMVERLEKAGLKLVSIRKVLGPLEKVTMCLAVVCFTVLRKWRSTRCGPAGSPAPGGFTATLFKWGNRAFAHVAWLDAFIVPRCLSTVLLIKAVKKEENGERSLSFGARD
jgi:SAM-dependent methyltransferase